MSVLIDIKVYLIRDTSGKYFTSRAGNWVDDPKKAKLFTKIGTARGNITWLSNHKPKIGIPDLLELSVTGVKVIDETKRIKKSQETKQRKEAERVKSKAKYKLEEAERNLKNAQNALNKLKK